MSYSTTTAKQNSIKSSKIKVTKISMGKASKNNYLTMEIKYYPWTKVNEIKTKLASINGIPSKNIRLFFRNQELMNGLSMMDYGIPFKKHPEIFYEIFSYQKDFSLEIYGTFPCSPSLQKIIEDSFIAFTRGLKPKMKEEGTSGVYQIRNVNKDTIAIFKPIDEEPNTPNNPKGYTKQFGSESFRRGILSGEATIREEAAYLLDTFSRGRFKFDVPATTFVEMCHKTFKINTEEMKVMQKDDKTMRGGIIQSFLYENLRGKKKEKNGGNDDDFFLSNMKYNYIPKKYSTLQKFIKSTGVVADYSYSLFSVEEAHKIMILDFRILNCDRNDENILLIKNKNNKNKSKKHQANYKLIPIDHAYSFPSCLEIGDFEICWMTWSQAEVPFTEEEKEYIESINILEDMKKLNEYIFLRPDCWKYFRISNTVLKICTKYNLTPYEIGSLLYHFDYDNQTPSKIKLVIEKTEKFTSHFKAEKRIRLFSSGSEKEIDEEKTVEKSKKCEKKRQNSFFREDRGKRQSLLESTTSEPKNKIYLNENEKLEEEEEDAYSNLRADNNKNKFKNKIDKKKVEKTSHKSSMHEEYIFDSPYNQLYFQNFTMFLEELIKKEFPKKAEIYENNPPEFELTIEERISSSEIPKKKKKNSEG
jgi:hypothetical protein